MTRRLLPVILAVLACIACASAALPTFPFPTSGSLPTTASPDLPATTAPLVTVAGNQLQVVSTSLEPPILMRGDTGTLNVEVANAGTAPVRATRASLLPGGAVTIVNDPYATVGEIGAGNRRTFSFLVRAGAPDGTAYPVFTLAVTDGRGLRHPVPVVVESTPPAVSFLQRPDAIEAGTGDQVVLSVGNPRQHPVTGVMVVPRGDGFTVSPTSVFIGELASNAPAAASFNLTPAENATIAFDVVYYNGNNRHAESIGLDAGYGQSKTRADLILSNFVVELGGDAFRLTGDVYNAGLSPARSVVIAPGEGVTPADPYPRYVIGSLETDDFASFELNFRAENRTTVPLVISYRDEDGDPFEQRTEASLAVNETAPGGAGEELPLAWIALALVLAAVVGYLIYRSWRR